MMTLIDWEDARIPLQTQLASRASEASDYHCQTACYLYGNDTATQCDAANDGIEIGASQIEPRSRKISGKEPCQAVPCGAAASQRQAAGIICLELSAVGNCSFGIWT